MVAELNFNSLENIHSWIVRPIAQAISLESFMVPINPQKLRSFSTSNDLQYTGYGYRVNSTQECFLNVSS